MNSVFENCYTSCGCNKTPHAADWGQNGLICFTSCNSVVIYNPSIGGEGGKIIFTLHGHKKRVNCVRWLKNNNNDCENEFISVSADNTAILWSWDEKTLTYTPEAELKGHTNIVTVGDGLIRTPPNTKYIPKKTPLLLATASIDSTVMVWQRNDNKEEIKCVHTVNWNSGFCLDVRFAILPSTNLALLACAADDNKVHLFVEHKKSEIDNGELEHIFHKIHVLSGHDDWVRAMDFVTDENNNLYLATGSQDTFIRIYKFQKKDYQKTAQSKLTNCTNKGSLEPEQTIIAIDSGGSALNFSVSLETVLAGHEGWVYGVSWHPPVYLNSNKFSVGHNKEITGKIKSQKLKLLSSSMDKTMIVWSAKKGGLWSEEARVGEVGGNMLGFYGGKFGPKGKSILGHGYQGSLHIWSLEEGDNGSKSKSWEPKVVVGGHTAGVMDLSWDVKGNYILSVGGDQTTRLHAPWVRNNGSEIKWYEIARPQVHGFDINCLAIISEFKFASGADEKVIRAFIAPNNFMKNFETISGVKIDSSGLRVEGLPEGASVPALGLSNKPVFEQMRKEGYIVDDEYPDLYFSPIHLTKPPTEENLMQNTLWPEVQDLYGHGYEIYSLAARKDGVILASSCKATSPEHAAIILWNARTWLQIQKLMSHQLTITQLSFSSNGKYLLSVSRDRRWSLFRVKEDGNLYELVATSDAKKNLHSRVIWSCSWTHDSVTFATGSRDGKIGFWTPTNSDDQQVVVKLMTNLELHKQSVTALAFAPVLLKNFHILAVGLESGSIFLYKYSEYVAENLWISFQGNLGHDLAVTRLAFSPKVGRAGANEETDKNNVIQLASCGTDHFLKIYDLFLDHL